MLALLNIFVDNMIPVLAIAAVGVVLRRRLHVDPAMISRMMFYVFAPALAFDAVFTSDISGGDFLRVYVGTLALMAAVGTIAFLFLQGLNCWWRVDTATVLGIDRRAASSCAAAYMQPARTPV